MAFLTEFLVDGDISLQLPFLLKWTTDFSFRRSSVGDVHLRVPAHGENAKQLLNIIWIFCASRSESQDEIKHGVNYFSGACRQSDNDHNSYKF